MAEKSKSDEKLEELGEEIKKLTEEVTERNRLIDDDYDERIKRLDAEKELVPENEQEEEKHVARIEELKEKLGELRARVSEARKSGKDPLIAALILKNVNAKIKMAEATHEEEDYAAVENILKSAELELEETLKQEEVDVKKEIETRLRQDIAKETGKVIAVAAEEEA